MYPAGLNRILDVTREIPRGALPCLLEGLVHISATPRRAPASGFIQSPKQEYFLGEAIPLEGLRLGVALTRVWSNRVRIRLRRSLLKTTLTSERPKPVEHPVISQTGVVFVLVFMVWF
jgi:hypothetical protein